MTGRAFTPEDLLASIRTLSTGSPSDLAQLAKQLKSSEDTLNRAAVGGAAALAEALASLDARTHTLGVLYLLCVARGAAPARLTRSVASHQGGAGARARARRPGGAFLGRAALPRRRQPAAGEARAREMCATQPVVCCAPSDGRKNASPVAALSRRVRDTALKLGTPGRGAAPLAAAARAVRPRPGCLTPQHGDCLLLSLAARNLAAALPLLGDDVLEVDPAATGSAPTDFVLFCFYGGAVLCAAKRFDRAAVLFAQALAAPATALNAIQVACYKKLARPFFLFPLLFLSPHTPLPTGAVVAALLRRRPPPPQVRVARGVAAREGLRNALLRVRKGVHVRLPERRGQSADNPRGGVQG